MYFVSEKLSSLSNCFFFFSSRRRHTRFDCDWSSDVCSSDLANRAPNGPLGMASPANTYVGLTHKGPAIAPGEPDKYYPNGQRNYIRLVAADDFQGAADAQLTQQLGYKKVFVLDDKEAYGLGVANDYANAAKKLGLKI